MRLRCHLYEALSSRRREGWLERRGDRFLFFPDAGGEDTAPFEELELRQVEPPVARGPRRITLADGRSLEVLDAIPSGFLAGHEGSVGYWIRWWEAFSLPKAALLVGVLIACLVGVRMVLPLAADLATRLVPHAAEAYVGEAAFEEYESILNLAPSSLPKPRRDWLRAESLRMADAVGLEHEPRILFRKMGLPNAFAFPGGPIVITDELVALLQDDKLILAVVGHELAHVEQRHGLRQIARAAGAVLIMTVALGGVDVSGVEELTTLAIVVASKGYSRDFEREADLRGAEIFGAIGGEPEDLAAALERLGRVCGESCQENNLFASHPGIQERIEALEALE